MSKNKPLEGYNNNRVENAIDDVSSKLRNAGRTAREFADEAQGSIANARDNVEEQIRANPFSAVAICVGAGLVLGSLLRRRA